MTLKTSLLGALALGLISTAAAAQNGVYGTALPGDGPLMSNSQRPPERETPPGDATPGTAASQSPDSQIGYGAPAPAPSADTGYMAPTSATAPDDGTPAASMRTVAMAPIPDTPQNRRLYGGPNSRGGRHTAARGN